MINDTLSDKLWVNPSQPYRAKIGTIPMTVKFRYRYALQIGKKVLVKKYNSEESYFQIIVEDIHADGFFFASRI